MIRKCFLLLLATIVGVAAPSRSFADPVLVFSFNSSGSNVGSLVKNIGNYSITVTPGTSPGGPLSQDVPILPGPNSVTVNAQITQQVQGLGTATIVNGSPYDVSTQTDANPLTYINNLISGGYSPTTSVAESLKFDVANSSANQVFILNSIDFAGVGLNDQVEVLVDGKSIFSGSIPGGVFLDFGTGTLDLSFLPEDVRTGTSFLLRTTDGNDGFFVSALNVTATPEPASIALFGITAIGGAFYGWRRRKVDARA